MSVNAGFNQIILANYTQNDSGGSTRSPSS